MEPLRGDDPHQVGRYRLVARLGSGGMGQVFLGFSPSGRPMAVKVVHRDLARDQAFLHRFRQEVAAARKVSGAYTAPVVDAGEGELPWLATTLVAGPSLTDAVGQQGPLPEAAVWRLAAGLVEALAEVHSCGLVHRDLKPSNVLLAADGPRVIDFGISRALDGTAITVTGMFIGSPPFMSPEQATGAPVGPASDVFSLGGVLTFAATGSAPFGDDNPLAMMYRVVHNEPALGDLPGALRDLVARCLTKNPEERATLAELMEDITANLTPAALAMSFWPEGLADFIGSYQARLTSGSSAWLSPAPKQAEPERSEPERSEPSVRDELADSAGSAELHGPTEVTVRHGQEDAPATITAERAGPPVPGDSAPRVSEPPVSEPPAARSGRGPGRRRALVAGIGVLAAGAVAAVVILATSPSPGPHSSSSGSSGPSSSGSSGSSSSGSSGSWSTLTVEATESGTVPVAEIPVQVLHGQSRSIASSGMLTPVDNLDTSLEFLWAQLVVAGTYQVCVQAPTGTMFVGANTGALHGWFCSLVNLVAATPPVVFHLAASS
jgi:eukaryotic-like serine/threonine-protein kinase